MRRALRAHLGVACLTLALTTTVVSTTAVAAPSEPKPVVHVVLVGAGEAPPWFAGFVKHLRSELVLRGIDVVEGAPARDADSGQRRLLDAELIVEIPSAQRPLLRFSPPDRDAKSPRDPSLPVRSIALGSVPADGHALTLAVAADELMRSNWSRARISPVAAPNDAETSATKDAASPKDATSPKDSAGLKDSAGPKDAASPRQGRPSDESKPPADPSSTTLATGIDTDSPSLATDRVSGPSRRRTSPCVALSAAAAAEIFSGGQTEVGPDVRIAVCIAPVLDIELRGGFRALLAHDATTGSVGGTALLGGGAVRWIVVDNVRGAAGLVGRADFVRAHYIGSPRDGAVSGTDGSALGVVVAAGGFGRLALTRWLSAQGELLAGGSPKSVTATADFAPAVSTSGVAVLASAGLSVGF